MNAREPRPKDDRDRPEPELADPAAQAVEPSGAWGGLFDWFRRLPIWQKGLFGIATTFLLLGTVAMALETGEKADARSVDTAQRRSTEQSPRGGAAPGSELVPDTRMSFLPEEEKSPAPTPETTQPPEPEPWSAGFFRLGFSFFAGFSIGLAMRSVLQLLTFGIGLALGLMFLLSYIEWIDVDWDRIGLFFEGLGTRVGDEAGRFRTFVTGSLPSTGLAATGLYTGLRRRR